MSIKPITIWQAPWYLDDIMRQVEPYRLKGANLCSDTRQLKPGDIFCAYQHAGTGRLGDQTGHYAYIEKAIDMGASALIVDDRHYFDRRLPCYEALHLGVYMGQLAHVYYKKPSDTMPVIGVTGTNGKTTITHWLAQAMNYIAHQGSQQRFALMGTLGTGFMNDLQVTGFTTPDAILLQQQLHQLSIDGASGLAMEVSSHGLDQYRVNGVRFHAAIFSNLSQDHLDYHKNIEEYLAAKTRLFTHPKLLCTAVNMDDSACQTLLNHTTAKHKLGYGIDFDPAAHTILTDFIHMTHYNPCGDGYDIVLNAHWQGEDYQAKLQLALLGVFNLYNVMAVLAGLLSLHVPWEQAINALLHLKSVCGRLEQVQKNPRVVIDYAHTPDALAKTLASLKPLIPAGGQLWCVFGCGGNRDPYKRPLMAQAVAQYADHIILTNDNPRDESPHVIIEEMIKGLNCPYQILMDRTQAIEYALSHAQANDTIVIAGKGHETYQEVRGVKHYFSDHDVVRQFQAYQVKSSSSKDSLESS